MLTHNIKMFVTPILQKSEILMVVNVFSSTWINLRNLVDQ